MQVEIWSVCITLILRGFVEIYYYLSTWGCFESSTVLSWRSYTWYQYYWKCRSTRKSLGWFVNLSVSLCAKLWSGLHNLGHNEIERWRNHSNHSKFALKFFLILPFPIHHTIIYFLFHFTYEKCSPTCFSQRSP